MSIAWLPWRRKGNNQLLGVEMSAEGIALARVVMDAHQSPRLVGCEYIDAQATDSLLESLKEKVDAADLDKIPCNWVLAGSDYTLLLVEAPNVPAEELREAMRWRVKDLIPFPVEQATLDVFLLPKDGVRSGKPMAYVVVSETRHIEEVIETAQTAKLNLQAIDIGEMALRNMANRVTTGERSVALVRLRPGSGNVALVRQGQLYLSRQFDLNYNGGLLDDLPEEALILELQRSLDYYERQMGQVPPSHIYLCGENLSPDKITSTIQNSLSGEVNCLPMNEMVAGADMFDEQVLQLCAGAIGGALRREVTV